MAREEPRDDDEDGAITISVPEADGVENGISMAFRSGRGKKRVFFWGGGLFLYYEVKKNKAQQANDGSLGIFKHIKH